MAINAQDILDTLANSVTYTTLTPGAAANAGGTATMEAQIVLDPRTKSAIPENLI